MTRYLAFMMLPASLVNDNGIFKCWKVNASKLCMPALNIKPFYELPHEQLQPNDLNVNSQ